MRVLFSKRSYRTPFDLRIQLNPYFGQRTMFVCLRQAMQKTRMEQRKGGVSSNQGSIVVLFHLEDVSMRIVVDNFHARVALDHIFETPEIGGTGAVLGFEVLFEDIVGAVAEVSEG